MHFLSNYVVFLATRGGYKLRRVNYIEIYGKESFICNVFKRYHKLYDIFISLCDRFNSEGKS